MPVKCLTNSQNDGQSLLNPAGQKHVFFKLLES